MPAKKEIELITRLNSIRLDKGNDALGEEVEKMTIHVKKPRGYVSAAIRALLATGMSRNEVAQKLSIPYQHVYNVSKVTEFKRRPHIADVDISEYLTETVPVIEDDNSVLEF